MRAHKKLLKGLRRIWTQGIWKKGKAKAGTADAQKLARIRDRRRRVWPQLLTSEEADEAKHGRNVNRRGDISEADTAVPSRTSVVNVPDICITTPNGRVNQVLGDITSVPEDDSSSEEEHVDDESDIDEIDGRAYTPTSIEAQIADATSSELYAIATVSALASRPLLPALRRHVPWSPIPSQPRDGIMWWYTLRNRRGSFDLGAEYRENQMKRAENGGRAVPSLVERSSVDMDKAQDFAVRLYSCMLYNGEEYAERVWAEQARNARLENWEIEFEEEEREEMEKRERIWGLLESVWN